MAYRIASYCRVSTTGQIDNGSIQEQEAKARALCQERGYDLVEVYRDEGISGSLFTERGELQRLISDARLGRFQFVLISAIDRLARTEIAFAQIVDALEHKLKIQVVDTLNPEFIDPAKFNPRDRGRRLMAGFKALLAQDDYYNTIERLSDGKRRALERGKYIFAHAPFGYQVSYPGPKERTLVPDPQTYPALDTIRRLALEGLGVRVIAARLDTLGIPTVKGGQWNGATVLNILRNPFYAGKIGYSKRVEQNGKLHLTGPEGMRYSEHSYLHPWKWEEWQELQRTIKARARLKDSTIPAKNVFSPQLRCGYCGGAMMFFRQVQRGKPFDYYICGRYRSNTSACRPNQIPARKLLAKTTAAIEEVLVGMQAELAKSERISLAGVGTIQAQFRKVIKQRETLKARREEILNDYASGLSSRDEYDRFMGASLQAEAKLEAEQARLVKELEVEHAKVIDSARLNSLQAKWQGVKVSLDKPIPDWTEAEKGQFKAVMAKTIERVNATNRGRGDVQIEVLVRGYIVTRVSSI